MVILRSQVASLGPMLDKINGSYFEKTHENAFFYHTNTLYLLLTVDRKIESELQTAETGRQAEHLLAYEYHTNQLRTVELSAAQIRDAMIAPEGRINAETRKMGEVLSEQLQRQIKSSASEATATAARLKQMQADVVQIKRDLEQIKVLLVVPTNPPPARP